MKGDKSIKGNVSLRRVALNDDVAARLAAESKQTHLPIQDLVGAACLVAIAGECNENENWHHVAKLLREKRTATKK